MKAAALFLFAILLGANSWASEDNLLQKDAEKRRAQVKDLSYFLHLTFEQGAERYSGRSAIELTLAQLQRPLRVDWSGEPPRKVEVNGAPITDYKLKTGMIEIPARHLKRSTTLTFEFTNSFSKEGEGIQRVIDPEDKSEYIYTDFEPFQAHQLFPCFDQPDLKAPLELQVTAPRDWKVISNERIAAVKEEANTSTTIFQNSPRISTYLFFVGAGDFAEWTDPSGKVPLALYSRKTLARYVDSETLFNVARKGLRFFSEYFGLEYPFSKLALLFVPEFNWGGMENPGAITLSERNLFRGPVPQSRRDSRDNLLLHEIAHLWFGDLVTMRWWNDLWLNESFASYLASIAQDRALGAQNVWQDFASGKTWGYWQDQLVTTHPIEAPVRDVRFARGNFDGITYAKGAAALQQLHFYVGEEAFREGVQSYFQKHAFGNAERADFVGAIASAAKHNLNDWTRTWLQTAGPNKVRVHWHCSDSPQSTITLANVEQEASSSGTFSPHRMRVGFFRKEGQELRLAQSADVSYQGKSTSLNLPSGVPCPDFVFPNLDDKDYALFSLDEKSLGTVSFALSGGIKDSLLRLQLWGMLYQMVRDGTLSPLRYLEIAVSGLSEEANEGVLATALGRHSPLQSVYNHYLSPRDRKFLAPGLESRIWERMLKTAKGSSLQMLFFDFYTRLVQSPEGLEELRIMLESNSPPVGIELDQDRRWAVVHTLARNGIARAEQLIENEIKRDPSSSGQRSAYAARVALPNRESKAKFWAAIEKPETIPPSSLRLAAAEFHQPNQQEISEAYQREFFTRIKKVNWKKSDQLVEIYFDRLFPHNLCSRALLERSKAELRASKGLTPLARRSWLEANDELARCLKVGRR